MSEQLICTHLLSGLIWNWFLLLLLFVCLFVCCLFFREIHLNVKACTCYRYRDYFFYIFRTGVEKPGRSLFFKVPVLGPRLAHRCWCRRLPASVLCSRGVRSVRSLQLVGALFVTYILFAFPVQVIKLHCPHLGPSCWPGSFTEERSCVCV